MQVEHFQLEVIESVNLKTLQTIFCANGTKFFAKIFYILNQRGIHINENK